MFSELDNVTSVYQELHPDKIDKILSAELARQGERVQFLGDESSGAVHSILGNSYCVGYPSLFLAPSASFQTRCILKHCRYVAIRWLDRVIQRLVGILCIDSHCQRHSVDRRDSSGVQEFVAALVIGANHHDRLDASWYSRCLLSEVNHVHTP